MSKGGDKFLSGKSEAFKAAYAAALAFTSPVYSVNGREAWALVFKRLAWELDEVQHEKPDVIEKMGEEQLAQAKAFAENLHLALREEPQDVAGELYMQMRWNDTRNEQIFTPNVVARFMASSVLEYKIDQGELTKNGPYIRCLDPFVGSGCLPLAALYVLNEKGIPYGQVFMEMNDIDPLCCDMAFVQLAYAGGFGRVFNEDTFRHDPCTDPADSFTPYHVAFNSQVFINSNRRK